MKLYLVLTSCFCKCGCLVHFLKSNEIFCLPKADVNPRGSCSNAYSHWRLLYLKALPNFDHMVSFFFDLEKTQGTLGSMSFYRIILSMPYMISYQFLSRSSCLTSDLVLDLVLVLFCLKIEQTGSSARCLFRRLRLRQRYQGLGQVVSGDRDLGPWI